MTTEMLGLPLVSIRSLGGTIAMTSDKSGLGASPTLDANSLIETVPALRAVATVDASSLFTIPGASLRMQHLLDLRDELERACLNGSEGLVVTQGTDTMEETSYFLDLIWARKEPLVFTGAMRPADAPGADGPANLLAAVSVAASPLAAERGSLVVMNDEIHRARAVRKVHTSSPSAFASTATGPVGRLHEGRVMFNSPPNRRRPFVSPFDKPIPRVGLLRVCLGDDPDLLDCAVDAYDGIVIEGFGGGHVPTWWMNALLSAGQRVPVVLASRTGSGSVLQRTYNFPGSEQQLLNAGLISAGSLDGIKARILLALTITESLQRESINKNFAERSEEEEVAGFDKMGNETKVSSMETW